MPTVPKGRQCLFLPFSDWHTVSMWWVPSKCLRKGREISIHCLQRSQELGTDLLFYQWVLEVQRGQFPYSDRAAEVVSGQESWVWAARQCGPWCDLSIRVGCPAQGLDSAWVLMPSTGSHLNCPGSMVCWREGLGMSGFLPALVLGLRLALEFGFSRRQLVGSVDQAT